MEYLQHFADHPGTKSADGVISCQYQVLLGVVGGNDELRAVAKGVPLR